VLPFEVRGQDEGAEYVGRAFAESLAAVLAEVDELDVVESRESAARVLTGTLTREGEEIQAAVRLIDAEHDDTTVWLLDVRSDGDSLSSLASGVARRVVDALDVVPPDLYEYIDDVALGPEIAASPLAARVDDARRRGDIPELVEASLALSERYGDEPTPHVLNAWALMRAWDADPSGETLARLKDRLVALQRVDPPSPYDELIRAYVYRSSGEPDQARTLYSQVLARGDLSTGARSWALRQRSLAALQVGDAAAARRDAEQAVALDPSSALNLVALSKALETLKLIDAAAESVGIECTTEAAGSSTRTDADSIHLSRTGVATAVVSIPLRYMHSPVELVELADVEATIAVIAATALRLEADQTLARW